MDDVPQSGFNFGHWAVLVFGYLPILSVLYFSRNIVFDRDVPWTDKISMTLFIVLFLGGVQCLLMWVFGYGLFEEGLLDWL
jgi:hypothetical protein